MEEQYNTFNNKKLKRLLVSIPSSIYNNATIGVKISCDNNNFKTLSLIKIGQHNDYNVYNVDCDEALNGSMFNYIIDHNLHHQHMPDSVLSRIIFSHDDQNYNHVNDKCKTNYLIPKDNEVSYSVYDSSFITNNNNGMILNEVAISLFVTK